VRVRLLAGYLAGSLRGGGGGDVAAEARGSSSLWELARRFWLSSECGWMLRGELGEGPPDGALFILPRS